MTGCRAVGYVVADGTRRRQEATILAYVEYRHYQLVGVAVERPDVDRAPAVDQPVSSKLDETRGSPAYRDALTMCDEHEADRVVVAAEHLIPRLWTVEAADAPRGGGRRRPQRTRRGDDREKVDTPDVFSIKPPVLRDPVLPAGTPGSGSTGHVRPERIKR